MNRIPRSVRQQVQKRAESRCEYCHIPDHVTHFSHQIDHIIPPRHGGGNDLPNLAWACFHCNNNKGTDIATYDLETRKPVFLYNPLYDEWNDHFRFDDDGFIVGKTPKGRSTARLLKINAVKRVEIRKALIQAGLWSL